MAALGCAPFALHDSGEERIARIAVARDRSRSDHSAPQLKRTAQPRTISFASSSRARMHAK
jgi:hypothetical protein